MIFSNVSKTRDGTRRNMRSNASRKFFSLSPKNGLRVELLETRILLTAGPLITEFVAANDSTLADGDGVYSDWIEIHNPASSPVSLDGWHLTDDRNDLTQWPLPDIALDAGEHRVFFASGQDVDNYVDAKGNYHTNFRLASEGGDLLLVEPDGETFDSTFLGYPEQSTDISYGLSIDGVTQTLLPSTATLSYRVPTAGDDPLSWTAVDFDDEQFIDQQTVEGAGLLITEVTTGDGTNAIEIQNVAADAIETAGWTVAINDASAGPDAVLSTLWNLPAAVAPAEILYRTGQPDEQYWGASIPWELDGPGWAIILNDAGVVQDAAVWGYSAAQIANMRVDVGPHTNIAVADFWQGDGADVGAVGGAIVDPVEIGPGADLAGASDVDSAGVRLNIEPEFVQTLSAGTYDVQDVAFAANSNGEGTLRAFLAVLTGGTRYETIWVSPETTPAAGDTLHSVSYAPASQQFTLDANADVYAGAWHDGDAKVRFSGLATITNHDSTPGTPTRPGQTITDFSHGTLNNRTYAYHVTIGSGGGATDSLSRSGATDGNSARDYSRTDSPTIGAQNPDSAPQFGGIVPTLAGIGFGEGDPVLEDLIQTDVAAAMRGTNASVWTRFEFTSNDLEAFDELTLRARYDDGFQAYLDGTPLVSRNAPAELSFDSNATASRSLAEALVFEEIDVTDSLDQLTAGDHVLAVHLLNVSAADSDLFFQPELLANSEGFGQFFEDATPGQASVEAGFNSVADTKFSVGRGFYDAPVDVEISTATVGARVIYTLDGTPPEVAANGNILNGVEYVAPLNIARTTTLRAMAFKQGLRSSNVDTQTYLFTSDIARQTRQSTIDAGFASSWGGRGAADYGLDPDVVGPNDRFGGVYAASIEDDLKSLPSLSLVLDIDDMFGSRGIYSNAGSRGQAWERPVSAELIYPDRNDGFQIDAGVRVHGGASRSLSRKNNLRLLFKEEYGASKLEYPLFGDGVDQFDTIVLRANFNDGWGWNGAGSDPLFARDQWHRQTQEAMGHTRSRSAYVHLYINGVYWGLYNPSERPDASFTAQHLGGDKTEWDSVNHNGVVDGSNSAWNAMLSRARAVDNASGAAAKWSAYQRLQGNDSDGNNHPSRENYLDIENYIDYLLISFYSGNDDWPTNNWYAARRRGLESEGFQFFAWDSEISMDLSNRTHLNENVIRDANNSAAEAAAAYGLLRNYDEFQLTFADRVQKHFFNGGVFYVDPENPAWDPANPQRNVPAARMVEITDEVSRAIVPESARWGDQHRSTPYTRNAEWQSELDHLLEVFFPQRTSIVLGQLRANNLYPDIDAPAFEVDGVRQHGGAVPAGAQLGLQNPNGGQGTIWFTTDGSDPRLPGGAVNTASAIRFSGPIELSEARTLKARVQNGNEWSALSEAFFAFDQTGLRIAEVNFNPADPSQDELAVDPTFDNDDFEFVEIVNTGDEVVNLDGVQLVDGIDFEFSNASLTLAPAERIVIVSNAAAFSTRYANMLDSITIGGEYGSSLSNGGETLKAVGALGQVLFEFEYSDDWFDQTDGGGYSLTVRNPSSKAHDLDQAAAWRPSNLAGGSPGSADTATDPGGVIVHELLATSDGSGWVELQNTTAGPLDIGHWYLSDSSEQLRKYQFAAGTVVPANGYLVVNEATQFGFNSADAGALEPFGLSRLGGRIYLTGGDQQGRLLGNREEQPFTPSEAGVAHGLYTKSTMATDFVRLQTPTPGEANAEPLVGPIIINEIMYHPKNGDAEFIEVRNGSNASVTLGNGPGLSWRFRGAIDFDFPPDAAIPPGSFAVLLQRSADGDAAAEVAAFRAEHGINVTVPIWTYSATLHGNLNNDGEKLFLEKPIDDLPGAAYSIIDAVRYNDATPWPTQPDGSGPSLSRFAPGSYGNDVANWGVSTRNGTPGRDNELQDTTPPTQPTNLVGRIESATAVSLSWAAAEDTESGIDHYRIYRDGQVIGTSVVTRFTADLQFASANANQYRVSAVNGDGIEGDPTVNFVDFSLQSADFQQGINGYRGTRDAEIREGDPNSNNGTTDTELEVDGEDGGTELSILLRWNELSVPQDAVVVGATMTLVVTNPGDEYAVHEVLRQWEEGQVTWNEAASNQSWQTAGARGPSDRGPQIGALSGANGTVGIEFNTAGLEMVQSWLSDPANSNFGIVISNTQQATDGVDLYSSEHSTASQRPKLSILYAPAPNPSIPGDFNLDDVVDDADIDMLVAAIASASDDPAFNVDGVGSVDLQDHDYLIREVMQIPFGDSTLDGTFDSSDFVAVFRAAEYEDNVPGNSDWAEGDWNGDGDFTTQDLVKAFQEGGYVRAAQPIASAGDAGSMDASLDRGDAASSRNQFASLNRPLVQVDAVFAGRGERPGESPFRRVRPLAMLAHDNQNDFASAGEHRSVDDRGYQNVQPIALDQIFQTPPLPASFDDTKVYELDDVFADDELL